MIRLWHRPISTAGDVLRLQPEITAGGGDEVAAEPGGNPWEAPDAPNEMKNCPFCGERIMAVARKCRYCEEYLDPFLREEAAEPGLVERMAMPVGRPGSAIAAGYLGLFCLMPLPLFGIAAIICGLIALRTLKRKPHLHGKGRAWFGLIMGVLNVLFFGFVVVMILIEAATKGP